MMKKDMEDRINKIEDLIAKGVTQEDIAKIIETSQKTVSQLISENIDNKFAEIRDRLPALEIEGGGQEGSQTNDEDKYKCPCGHEDIKVFSVCPKCDTGLSWGD